MCQIHWHHWRRTLCRQSETALRLVFLVVVQFVRMRIQQHKYNEVWPEGMQGIMKAVISGETIQRIGKVKIILDQQVSAKQSGSDLYTEKKLPVVLQDLWSQQILQAPETCPYYGDW